MLVMLLLLVELHGVVLVVLLLLVVEGRHDYGRMRMRASGGRPSSRAGRVQ